MAYALGNTVRKDIITQTEAFGDVSKRYIATSTEDIITEMNHFHQFAPVGFSNSQLRNNEREGFQKHTIMLEAPDAEMIDGTKMRVVLFNSNDRSTSIRLYLGLYRDACANDCVFGQDFMDPIFIRHTKKDWRSSVRNLMDEYENIQQKTDEMINRMMDKKLSYGDIGRYTERLASAMNKEITGEILDPMQFNIAQRQEDTGKDLWSLYQRSQEHVLKGGVDRIIPQFDPETNARLDPIISKTHVITSDMNKIKMNRMVHDLAYEMVS